MQAKELVRAKLRKLSRHRPRASESRGLSVNLWTLSLGSSIDTIFWPISPMFCERSNALRPKLFGQLRAFPFPSQRKNMPNTDARKQTAQNQDVTDDHSPARELQRVLSLSLPSFYRCALRLLGNSADAEDAVQEALLAAYKNLHQFRGQSQMSTWLTTIVRNCARMQLRKRPRQIHMPLNEQIGEGERYFISERLRDTRPNPEDQCRDSELAVHLRKCAELLSPSLRKTFQLRVANGLSIFETAQVLGVPQGTVKARLARARTNLARYMRRALEPRSRMSQRAYRTSRRRKVISRVELLAEGS